MYNPMKHETIKRMKPKNTIVSIPPIVFNWEEEARESILDKIV